ncbi:MAG TPA: DUF4180 domain-containing protein [Myxococcota bacterium]|nr:DUF4180 domain-containing protein [Myxococcota bacterium]
MKTRLVETEGHRFIEVLEPITRVDDSVDVVGQSFEARARGVLIDHALLPEAFFELRTRFLGEFLQRLVNYERRLAVVLPAERELSVRFQEFLREAKRGASFSAFTDRAEAEKWLSGAP